MHKHFVAGLFKNNPVLILLLGLCPVVAVSTNALNSLGMGIAVMIVLILSNVAISTIRWVIPETIRLTVFIVIIATFVTIVDYILHAYIPDIYAQLGIFIPLIVVNCVILCRAEVFASKNGILVSAFDGLGVGLGYTMVIFIVGVIRELFGSGKVCGYPILGQGFTPVIYMILPPGGFLMIGLLMGICNWWANRK